MKGSVPLTVCSRKGTQPLIKYHALEATKFRAFCAEQGLTAFAVLWCFLPFLAILALSAHNQSVAVVQAVLTPFMEL